MDKKNTLLLTVIAVATLLVAIVGATFAYFTAQVGAGAQAQIDVTTKTSDSLSYGTFSNISIVANQQNFAEGKGSQRGTSDGSISLTANSENEATYCYTVTLAVDSNSFSHHPTIEEQQGDLTVEEAAARAAKPELLFSIYKSTTATRGEDITDGDELTDLTLSSDGESSKNLQYYTLSDVDNDKLSNKYVCDQVNGVITNGTAMDSHCPEESSIKGYDITTVKAGNVNIPNNGVDKDTQHPNVFKLTAAKGATATHFWRARVTFVNYKWDQQYNATVTSEQAAASNGSLTAKTVAFSGTLKFTSVDCTNGQPLQATP